MPDGGLTWVDRLEPAQAEQLVGLFSGEWWTQGRDIEGVMRMLAGSAEVVAALDGDRLVAFGRVVGDGVYRATINDVIIAESHRDRGLGTAVVRTLLARPAVAASSHVDLHCIPAMIFFYERLGFKRADPDLRRMEIKTP